MDGTILTLTYNEALDTASQPAAGAFAVTVDGTARTVDAVALSGSAVALTLASAVAAEETVTVGYTVPAGADAAPLQDAAGNDAASFAGEAVTNDTPEPENAAPAGLPEISGTAQVGETLTASVSAIEDADGLDNATFAYQWLANDGTDDSEIAGATAAAYEVAGAGRQDAQGARDLHRRQGHGRDPDERSDGDGGGAGAGCAGRAGGRDRGGPRGRAVRVLVGAGERRRGRGDRLPGAVEVGDGGV